MIFVVGLGPGGQDQMTPRACAALEECDVIVGYKAYVDLVAPFFPHKDLRPSPMKGEVERCRQVLDLSRQGLSVALISSGDPGVYGMAGIMLELASENDVVEIIPGMTAADAAAAVLGAPLMHDFAVISLSDLMTPWELIEKRLAAAAQADFVICLYNPVSRGRPEHLRRACGVLERFKSPSTPAGWVRNAGRSGQASGVTTLERLSDEKLDMFCTVVIGSSATFVRGGRMITPRGYRQ